MIFAIAAVAKKLDNKKRWKLFNILLASGKKMILGQGKVSGESRRQKFVFVPQTQSFATFLFREHGGYNNCDGHEDEKRDEVDWERQWCQPKQLSGASNRLAAN